VLERWHIADVRDKTPRTFVSRLLSARERRRPCGSDGIAAELNHDLAAVAAGVGIHLAPANGAAVTATSRNGSWFERACLLMSNVPTSSCTV
jgi:hypothetical protein